MAVDYPGVKQLERVDGGHAGSAVHEHLRSLILTGAIKPGTFLNQVELAPLLGVSRTPLREAIRMLQEEDLVDAEPQKRARVKEFDIGRLEAIYAQRILLEGLGARLTAPAISPDTLDEIEQLLAHMSQLAEEENLDEWQAEHRNFHRLLISGANPALRSAMESLMDRGEQYRFVYQVSGPRSWAAGAAEHGRIVQAYRDHDGALAAQDLAAHLARTALSIIAQVAPEHDPVTLREALALHAAAPPPVERMDAGDSGGKPRRRRRAKTSAA
jgi:DNA-binding GntR family transcriptional regulator